MNATKGSSPLTLTFGYGTTDNNGNVLSQQIQAPGSPSALNATQYYLYDELNRLGIVAEGAAPTGVDTCGSVPWCRDYGYDRYGNRAVINAVNGGLSLATPTVTSAYTASNNRLTSSWANYDAAGNISAFVKTGYTWSAFYDAENKQRFYCGGTTSACSSANDTAEYVYDGEGNRVQKKVAGGETVTYVYDAFGRLAAEYSTAGPSGTAGSYFRTTDHLGSTRLVTDGSGAVHDRRDFFPFGEKILASSTYSNRHYVTGYNDTDPASAHLFTAKERDDESGLDYFLARYMSSALGRFTGADPLLASGRVGDPQSWNRFAYARNNPMRYVDPTGLDYYDQNGNRIGTDGNQNGDHYIVTDKKEIKQIKNADKNGSLTATSQVSSAVALPGQAVRAEIGAAVDRSNGPVPGDPTGGFHEEGGVFGLDASGSQTAIPAAPGPANTAGVGGAQIDVGMPSDPANANVLQSVQGNYHVHPSGSYPNG